VLYWACCLEEHKNSGKHYHLCLKLSNAKRWKRVKDAIFNEKKIVLHFSFQHLGYNVAYKYICKSDKNVLHSSNHPNLSMIGPPRTINAVKTFVKNSKKRKSLSLPATPKVKKSKMKRLTNIDVAEFMVSNNIRTEEQLMLLFRYAPDQISINVV
jgi:hypothetical protein